MRNTGELSTPLARALEISGGGGQSSRHLPGGSHGTLLSSQLRKEYGANVVPAFPPKKIFTLTPAEVEQRREQLEKYMQAGKLGLPRAAAQGWLGLPRAAAQGWLPAARSLRTPGHCPHLLPHTAPFAVAHLDTPSLALVLAGLVHWMSAPPSQSLPCTGRGGDLLVSPSAGSPWLAMCTQRTLSLGANSEGPLSGWALVWVPAPSHVMLDSWLVFHPQCGRTRRWEAARPSTASCARPSR